MIILLKTQIYPNRYKISVKFQSNTLNGCKEKSEKMYYIEKIKGHHSGKTESIDLPKQESSEKITLDAPTGR